MNLVKTIALSFSLWCLLSNGAWAAKIQTPQGIEIQQEQTIETLLPQQIIYLGETHDSAIDHQLQLAIIQALHQRRPNLTIALEQFQRPYQSILDAYLQNKITETQLITNSEYEKRWGFPWKLYAPIIQFAKNNQLPLVALNTPSEVTRKVSRQGIANLTLADRRFIPPLSSLQIGPDSYRDRIQKIYTEMHQGKGNSKGFNRFFEAQILWDETMADRIVHTLKANPDRLIIVLVGHGHLLYHDGIPNRVTHRLKTTPFKQTTILLNPDPTWERLEPTTKQPIADLLWNSER
jgi:uncharacterized iron-regulated protein